MNPYQVLLSPVISEKSNALRESETKKQYTFKVNVDASKLDIKKALLKAFEVKAEKIQTAVYRGKIKRRGKFLSRPHKYKKATITLVSGQSLKMFEDQ